MSDDIAKLKKKFNFIKHPSEPGLFVEVWRSDRQTAFVEKTEHSGPRDVASTIHFLLEAPSFVSWHVNRNDAIFVWNAGGSIHLHTITPGGSYACYKAGDVLRDPECSYQVVVPHDTWYAVQVEHGAQYAMFTDIVMPGWDAEDWFVGKKDVLTQKFPEHSKLFDKLCSE